MPKGRKSEAKCSKLRMKACLDSNDECVWCKGKGRCFVKAYSHRMACSSSPASPLAKSLHETETDREILKESKEKTVPFSLSGLIAKEMTRRTMGRILDDKQSQEYRRHIAGFINVYFHHSFDITDVDGYRQILADMQSAQGNRHSDNTKSSSYFARELLSVITSV